MDADGSDQSTNRILWALQQPIRAKDKMVLVAIASKARRMEGDDFAWASVAQIAQMTGRGRAGVAYSIECLKNDGFIRHLRPNQIHLPSGIRVSDVSDPHELEYEWLLKDVEVLP
jgi:hypothetical protein